MDYLEFSVSSSRVITLGIVSRDRVADVASSLDTIFHITRDERLEVQYIF